MAKQLRRFSNRAQLIRHVHQETGVPIDELWDQLNKQLNDTSN